VTHNEPTIHVSSNLGVRSGPEIPPWLEARAAGDMEDDQKIPYFWWEIHDIVTERITNAYDTEETIRNYVTAETRTPDSDIELAIDFIAIFLSWQLHEMFEWVKVDGKRIASPHPETWSKTELIPDKTPNGEIDKFGYWNWSIDELRKVVKSYCQRYPTKNEEAV
jgi:hypothetical protein